MLAYPDGNDLALSTVKLVPKILRIPYQTGRLIWLGHRIMKLKKSNLGKIKFVLIYKVDFFVNIHFSMQGFNESERLLYKAVVFSNIVQSMLAILRAMKSFNIDFEDEDTEHAGARFFEETECEH